MSNLHVPTHLSPARHQAAHGRPRQLTHPPPPLEGQARRARPTASWLVGLRQTRTDVVPAAGTAGIPLLISLLSLFFKSSLLLFVVLVTIHYSYHRYYAEHPVVVTHPPSVRRFLLRLPPMSSHSQLLRPIRDQPTYRRHSMDEPGARGRRHPGLVGFG